MKKTKTKVDEGKYFYGDSWDLRTLFTGVEYEGINFTVKKSVERHYYNV